MSKTKKVLSLVMAIALVFNVLALISSAACADDKLIGFSAVTDDALVAGGEVTVDFYFELPEGTDYETYMLGTWQLIVSYNSNILTFKERVWSDRFEDIMASSNSTNDAKAHGWISQYLTTEEAAKYTNSVAVAGSQIDGNNSFGYSNTGGFNLTGLKEHVFSIVFTVADDYDGTSSAEVAILKNAFQNATRCYYRDFSTVGNKVAKDGSQTDFTESATVVKAPVAASKVYEVAKQGQWADKENGVINLGVKAGFNTKDIAIAFDANGTSTNVMTVGAKLTVHDKDGNLVGTLPDGTSRFVYKISDTEYQYRVKIEGVAKDSTDVYTVELFAEVKDEATGKTTIITGDTVTITAADVVGKLPA